MKVEHIIHLASKNRYDPRHGIADSVVPIPMSPNLIHGDATTRPKKQLHLRWPHLSQNIPALSLPRPDFQKYPVTDAGWIPIQKGGHGSRLGDKGNPSFMRKRLVEINEKIIECSREMQSAGDEDSNQNQSN